MERSAMPGFKAAVPRDAHSGSVNAAFQTPCLPALDSHKGNRPCVGAERGLQAAKMSERSAMLAFLESFAGRTFRQRKRRVPVPCRKGMRSRNSALQGQVHGKV